MERVPCGVMWCVLLTEDNSDSQGMIIYFIGFVCRVCSGINNIRLNVYIIILFEPTQKIIGSFCFKPTINPLGTWDFIMARSTHHMGWMLISYSGTLFTKMSLFCLEPVTVNVNMTISFWNLTDLWKELSRCYRAAGQVLKQNNNNKNNAIPRPQVMLSKGDLPLSKCRFCKVEILKTKPCFNYYVRHSAKMCDPF